MSYWGWLLEVVVFFVVVKAAQILFWNLRKTFYVHPWLVELLVAIVVVSLLQAGLTGWWTAVVLGVLFGVVRGDTDEESYNRRQLL
jgi:H+-translocating NAD(P) transhydrogenase subunit alpha